MAQRVNNQGEALRLLSIAEAMHGYPMKVDFNAWKAERTDPQKNYLFGVAYPPLADAMGYPVDGDNGIHAFMCGTFFGWVDRKVPKTPRNPEGIASFPIRSTTRTGWGEGKRDVIDVETFSRFVELVQRTGAHAGVFIPDPEQKAA